jgi:predicted Fe-Mo cluster-binding NifX family protein
MKIALSSEGKTGDCAIDPRFGRAKFFVVFDETNNMWDAIDNIQNLQAAQGAGIQSAATIVNAGCGVLISGHCGPKAFAALSKAGVVIYLAPGGTVAEAVEAYRNGKLERLDDADVDGHW